MMLWPICVLTPRDVQASPSGQAALQGGRNLAGGSRTAQWSAGGQWGLRYQTIHLRTRTQLLMASALDAYLDGGATPIIVPRRPGIMAPDAIGGLSTFGDGSTFSDGSGFATFGDEGSLVADVAMNDTVLQIRRPTSRRALIGGEDFSVLKLVTPDMHRIARITATDIIGDDTIYTIEVRPPFRDDHAAGSALNFSNPLVRAKLMNAGEFSAMVKQGRYGTIDAVWEEV